MLLIGRYSVGLGSDYDGIGDVPVGLEDVTKYPDLVRDVWMSTSIYEPDAWR